MKLVGKTVLLTGAAGFLGERFATRLAMEGGTLILSDLDEVKLAKIVEVISSSGSKNLSIHIVPVDLSREDSVVRWANEVLEKYGTVDVLINNAAIKPNGFFNSLEGYSVKTWNEVMAVNVTGVFLAIREIGAKMKQRGSGSIINISSVYGIGGPDNRIYEESWHDGLGSAINTPMIYSASKGALISMTKYLAAIWGSSGVRTNCLVPGGVRDKQSQNFIDAYSNRVPLGRMAEPEELLGALIYLASDDSTYTNGSLLVVDGGLTSW